MAAESLQAQLSRFLDVPDPSQRESLLTAIKQRVLSLELYEEFASTELPQILELGERSQNFWTESGAELWESCLVLEALSPCECAKRLTSEVVAKANLGELLAAWKVATTALLTYESPSQGFMSKIFEVEEKPLQLLDRVKTATAFCLSRLVSDLAVAELQDLLVSNIEDFLELLCKAMEEAYKYLRSDQFSALLSALRSRVDCLQDEKSLLPALKVGSVLLGLLADSDALDKNQGECVEFILGLGQDFHSLLITWRTWFVSIFKPTESSDLHNYSAKGIAVLASLSTQATPHKHLHLPCAFSPLYRLQVYVPIANLVFYTHPEVAIALLDHAVSHFAGKFRSIKSPFLLVPEGRQSTQQFLKELLDLLSRSEGSRQKHVSALLASFLAFFSDSHRFLLVRKLLLEYSNDYAIGLVVDLYREDAKAVPLLREAKRVLEITKLCFRKKPPADFAHTIQSAAQLYIDHFQSLSLATAKKIRSKYLNPLHTMLTRALEANRALDKVQTAVERLAQAISLSQE